MMSNEELIRKYRPPVYVLEKFRSLQYLILGSVVITITLSFRAISSDMPCRRY